MAKKKTTEIAEKTVEVKETVETVETQVEAVETVETQVEINEEAKEEIVEVKEEPKQELPNVESLLLNYISSQEGEEVELNEFFSKIHAKQDSYTAAKLTKQLLTKLSIEGKINMSDVNWNDLDMHYYEIDGKSKKYLISDIKILAKK